MKKRAALLAIVASLTFACAASGASTQSSNSGGAKDSKPATHAQLHEVVPTATAESSPKKSHTFRVNDKKGLLLTCVAPQITVDPDTDIFEDCSLAPGRTLDDVMHSFVGAIHYEQNQHAQERAQWTRDLEEKSNQKASQK